MFLFFTYILRVFSGDSCHLFFHQEEWAQISTNKKVQAALLKPGVPDPAEKLGQNRPALDGLPGYQLSGRMEVVVVVAEFLPFPKHHGKLKAYKLDMEQILEIQP